MKKTTLLIAIIIVAGLSRGQGQGTWTQKADFGGGPREGAVGFSIGVKGYLGTGVIGSINYLKDFWEYDASANTWTQKADLAGNARSHAAGFSIGNKGYVGTGGQDAYGMYYDDFWEYDPGANRWTQKADFGGSGRVRAVGFSLSGKGYIGTGGSYAKDFWEYNPAANSWTQKADFGGEGRSGAIGFSLGDKGYIGTGFAAFSGYVKDFWEYNPVADTWTQKADFGGIARAYAVGFGIGSKGYIGTGNVGCCYMKDFWEYDSSVNTWTQKADFGGAERIDAAGFNVSGKGYLGTGSGTDIYKDIWEYTPDGTTSTCDTPTSLSTSSVSDTTADLRWDPVSGAVQYDVSYKVAGTSQFTIVHSTGTSTTISGLTPLTQYVWKVRTVCSLSPPIKSAYSAQVQFTTSNGCDVPTGLFSEPTATRAFLAWDNADGAISYVVMYQVAGDPLWATVRARGSFITLRGLTPRTTYYWKVKTICSDSPPVSSEYSPQESFFTFPR